MAKPTWPKAGTKLSVEWTEDGPLITVEGIQRDLAISFSILSGILIKHCRMTADGLKVPVAAGPVLLHVLTSSGATIDMCELERQAAAIKKENSHEDT